MAAWPYAAPGSGRLGALGADGATLPVAAPDVSAPRAYDEGVRIVDALNDVFALVRSRGTTLAALVDAGAASAASAASAAGVAGAAPTTTAPTTATTAARVRLMVPDGSESAHVAGEVAGAAAGAFRVALPAEATATAAAAAAAVAQPHLLEDCTSTGSGLTPDAVRVLVLTALTWPLSGYACLPLGLSLPPADAPVVPDAAWERVRVKACVSETLMSIKQTARCADDVVMLHRCVRVLVDTLWELERAAPLDERGAEKARLALGHTLRAVGVLWPACVALAAALDAVHGELAAGEGGPVGHRSPAPARAAASMARLERLLVRMDGWRLREVVAAPRLLSGAEVLALGCPQGPAMSRVLGAVLDWHLLHPDGTPAQAADVVRALVAAMPVEERSAGARGGGGGGGAGRGRAAAPGARAGAGRV
jgi:hypothetical protein